MKQKKIEIRLLAQISLLVALMFVLSFTPLGFIPLGFMNATTMHIPVIIGACLLGPRAGALLGGIFGIASVVRATISPVITSFLFTPFYSFSPSFHGNWTSLIVAIVPRVLIGIIAGFAFRILMKATKDKMSIPLAVSGFIGSLTNTIGVMIGIYLFFGEQYAAAKGEGAGMVWQAIIGALGVQGFVEAIVAAILTLVVGKVLYTVFRQNINTTKTDG